MYDDPGKQHQLGLPTFSSGLGLMGIHWMVAGCHNLPTQQWQAAAMSSWH